MRIFSAFSRLGSMGGQGIYGTENNLYNDLHAVSATVIIAALFKLFYTASFVNSLILFCFLFFLTDLFRTFVTDCWAGLKGNK